MAAITHICTLDYVAKMMDEDLELLEAIVWNDDNLTYGSIRGGSVCLNSYGAFSKWISALVMPLPLRAPAG